MASWQTTEKSAHIKTKRKGCPILIGQPFFVMGFSLLRTLEFFVFRKMENVRNIKPTCYAGGVKMLIAKNHLFVTIELFRHYRRKEKVI